MEINLLIRREMNRARMLQSDLAKKLNVRSTTVFGMLRRPDMQVHRLIQLSEIFQFNFFREIAATLPYQDPDNEVKVDIEAIKAPLLEKIKNQELEISILRQTLKDVVSSK